MSNAPTEVELALKYISSLFPDHERITVVFFSDQRWLYFGDDNEAFTFPLDVDVGILEDAMDAVEALPVAYEYSLRLL